MEAMSALWRFNLLGNLAIEENGRASPIIKSDRSCALLAYLLVSKQTHNREQLADLCWESQDTAQAMARLRTILSRTKKLLPALTVTRKQVGLTLAPDTFVDLYALEAGLLSDDVATKEFARRSSSYWRDLCDLGQSPFTTGRL